MQQQTVGMPTGQRMTGRQVAYDQGTAGWGRPVDQGTPWEVQNGMASKCLGLQKMTSISLFLERFLMSFALESSPFMRFPLFGERFRHLMS